MSDRAFRRAFLSLSVSSVALLIAAPGVAAAQTASQQPAQQRCTDPATTLPDGSCPKADQTTPPADTPDAPRTPAELPSSGGTIDGKILKVFDVTPLPAKDPKGIGGKYGDVVEVSADGFTVVCPDGRIKVTRVQPADGPKVGAGEWATSISLAVGMKFI